MKKILPIVAFAMSLAAGVAKAQSCADGATNSVETDTANGVLSAQSTACLTLTCSAQITALTSKFELTYQAGSGAGQGLPGSFYENSATSASFHFENTCPAKVTADISKFALTDLSSNTHTIPVQPYIGLDAASDSTNDNSVLTEASASAADHSVIAGVTMPSTMVDEENGDALPAGEYDATVTLTIAFIP